MIFAKARVLEAKLSDSAGPEDNGYSVAVSGQALGVANSPAIPSFHDAGYFGAYAGIEGVMELAPYSAVTLTGFHAARLESDGRGTSFARGAAQVGFGTADYSWEEVVGDVGPETVSFVTHFSITASNPTGELRLMPYVIRTYSQGSTTAPILSAVPEPETYALMITGLGMLGFVGRRSQRRN